jgi:mRNA interferase MazF
MEKEFEKWSIKKEILDKRIGLPLTRERDVFWCSIGINIGDEENGKNDLFSRPVLIFKKFSSNLFRGIPMTSKNKNNDYYIQVEFKGLVNSVMISHLRLYDIKRLGLRMGRIGNTEYDKIIKSITNLIPKLLEEDWGCD